MSTWFAAYAEGNFRTLIPIKPLTALQVGVYEGDATEWLIRNREITLLVDVDNWDGTPMPGVDYAAAEAIYDVRVAGLTNIEKVKASSDEFFRSNRRKFDFIYIDGSHEADQVYKDGVNAWKALKRGGLLAFDDYQWSWNGIAPGPGIDRAVAEMRGAEVVLNGYQFWVRKP